MSASAAKPAWAAVPRRMTAQRLPAMSNERGMALVMALVILLILTMIGVTAMSTSTLQEKMAGNVQEQTRAFHAAESGLNQALNTPGAMVLTGQTSFDFTFGSVSTGGVTTSKVVTNFRQSVPPARGSGYSASSFSAANFDQESTGRAASGATAVVHRGVAQIVPK